ncbi:Uncharacterized protein Rs2_38208 [Raphanus sativus]|nr:Uncharacterized protein Rs2_38208 [Raphanus sativus]
MFSHDRICLHQLLLRLCVKPKLISSQSHPAPSLSLCFWDKPKSISSQSRPASVATYSNVSLQLHIRFAQHIADCSRLFPDMTHHASQSLFGRCNTKLRLQSQQADAKLDSYKQAGF